MLLPIMAPGGFSVTQSLSRASNSPVPVSSLSQQRSLRYAVLGAGFAGLSVAWHLLKHSSKELHLRVDIYDEVGIGGGASGVSGGLLHPYSPKAKLLWRGAECWNECLELLSIVESAAAGGYRESNSDVGEVGLNSKPFIVRRRGILRPAMSTKNLNVLSENARDCLASCRIESIDKGSAQNLVPNLCLPYNLAFYMPEAVNIHPQRYLQGLFQACENLVKELSILNAGGKELYLHKKSVHSLLELEGTSASMLLQITEMTGSYSGNFIREYDAAIICLGAKAEMLPELSGRLPLRTCRGVVAHLQLPEDMGEEYPDHGASILSDAWLAVQGPRDLCLGATWEWKSRNFLQHVSVEEASTALQELLPKASAIYPSITDWTFVEAKAGIRAMPPLTPYGSLPLLGCVDDFLAKNHTCKYWLFGGLGARGLLYHSWLGKLTAQAALSCKEELIPSELTSWKNINR